MLLLLLGFGLALASLPETAYYPMVFHIAEDCNADDINAVFE